MTGNVPPWPGSLDSVVREQLLVCSKFTPEQWSEAKGRVAGMFAEQSLRRRRGPLAGLWLRSALASAYPWMLSPCKRILVRAGGRVGRAGTPPPSWYHALTHPGGRYRAVGVTFRGR